jgi:hypothetical protein
MTQARKEGASKRAYRTSLSMTALCIAAMTEVARLVQSVERFTLLPNRSGGAPGA